jgi:hypothetical protein
VSQSWKKAERKVAKQLGEWACGNKEAFARMGLPGRMLEEFLGDIIVNCRAPESLRKKAAEFLSKYIIDVKRRKGGRKTGWHFEQFLTSPKHEIFKWWQKLNEAAQRHGKTPLLIVTRGDGRWFLIMSETFYLKNIGGLVDVVVVRVANLFLAAANLDTFLKEVSAEALWDAAAERNEKP